MNGQRLDVLYYELELRTSQYDEQINHIDQRLRTLTDSAPHVVRIGADTSGAVKEFQRLASSAAIATSAMLAVAAAGLKMADDLKLAENRLLLVTNSTGDLARAQVEVGNIANRTYQSYAATLELYGRLARSTQDLRVSQSDLLVVTEAVSTATRLSGVSAQAAENALVQLGQAFASKELRGDELRSVLEQLPRLAEAIATGMGTTVGELRKLAAEGQLTADKVFGALKSQLHTLQEEAAKLPPTMGQAMQVFTNEAAKYVTGTADAAQATQTLAKWIVNAADHFEKLASVALIASGIFVGRSLGPMLEKGAQLLILQAKQIAQAEQQVAARVQEAAAAVESAQAEQRAVQARMNDLQATKAAIIAERELATARLASANARLATATAAVANPAASGMTTKEALAAQAAAQQNLSRSTADLARLGQQQARVQQEIRTTTVALTAATEGAVVAEGAHAAAIAGTTLAARAGQIALTGLKGVMAFLGGPIGAAITAALVGVSWALNKKAEQADITREKLARYQQRLESLTDAEIRHNVGLLEGARIALLLERQKPENQNAAAQNELSIRENEILGEKADLMALVAKRTREATTATNANQKASIEHMAVLDLATEQFRKYGDTASKAIERAAEKWTDKSRTFVEAYRAGDKAALDHLAIMQREIEKEEGIQKLRQESSRALKESAKDDAGSQEAVRRFEELTVSVREYAASLTEVHRPMAEFESKSGKMARELEDLIQKLPKTQRAAARLQAGTLIDQLAEAGDQLRATKADEIAERIATVMAKISTDTIAQLTREYDALIKQQRIAAEEAESLGTAEGKLNAKRARESIPVLEEQKQSLIALEKIQGDLKRSYETIRTFEAQSNANFKGKGVTLADYKKALADVVEHERRLTEERDKTIEGTAARAEAEEKLAAAIAERTRIEEKGKSTTGTPKLHESVGLTIAMGAGLRNAAQAGLALVQVLGKSNSELAQGLAGAISLAGGIESVGKAAKDAGGWGKLFSGKDIMTSLPGIGQMVGGGIAIAQSLGVINNPETERLKETQKANTRALEDLTHRIGDLAASSFGANQFAAAQQLVEHIFKQTLPYNATRKVGNAADLSSAMGLPFEELQRIASALGVTLDGTVHSFRMLYLAMREADFALLTQTFEGLSKRYDLLSLIAGKAEDPLERVTNNFRVLTNVAPELAKLFDQNLLGSTEGRTQLRNQIAEFLKNAITLDPNSAEAKALYAQLGDLSPQQFLDLFTTIITGLDGMAEAAEGTVSALQVFADKAKLFGIKGADYLTELVSTYQQTFPELAGLLDDIDLGTQAGRDQLQERLQQVYAMAAADGKITESEQAVIDALLSIMEALGGLPDILDPIAQAMEAFDAQAKAFGFTNEQRFQGRGALLSAKNAGLGSILGSSFQLDILTDEGRKGLADRLRQGISDIISDGVISDAERPLLDALQELLDLVLGAMDDATSAANEAIRKTEEEAQAREQERQQTLTRRGQRSNLDVQLGDLEGADALRATFTSYSDAFNALLATFDLSNLASIETATGSLQTLVTSLDGLSDEEILAKWGMTRDEITAAILAVDGGLDGLTTSLKNLAKEQGDFLTNIQVDYLNAMGQGLDAVKLQTELWVEAMIAQAKLLGVWTEEIDTKIRKIGQSKIDAAMPQDTAGAVSWEQRIADTTAAAVANVARAVASGQLAPDPSLVSDIPAPTQRDEFVASDITRLSTTEALRMTDYLAMIHVEGKATRLATEQIAAMMSLLVSGSMPSINIPRLPASFGTGGSGSPVVIQITGDVYGMDADDVAEAIAKKVFPYINRLLYQDALREARNAGRSSLS